MAIWHLRSKRSPTGKKLNRVRKKKRRDRGSLFLETKIGKRIIKRKRSKGGNAKAKLSSIDAANLANPKTGKISKAKILAVTENTANPHYVRRNVLTKGAVIKTETGLARVTSRPGQDGVINAVLIEEKKE